MTVYLVQYSDGFECYIHECVFSSYEKAFGYIEYLCKDRGFKVEELDVFERELDDYYR